MNNDDEFIERLRNREIASLDQRGAQESVAKDQQRVEQAVREGAKSAFEEMRSFAESLVQQANVKLTEQFTSVAAPGGFGIMLGNRLASFAYAPPTFANEGVPHVIVTIQTLASNVAFLRVELVEAEPSASKWHLEPVWDASAQSVLWRSVSHTYSSRDAVRRVMELLQARTL